MKIVVNGCFDLFHDGHKYLLSKALSWSNHEEVLVLINSDSSVRSIKGDRRPIQSIEDRCHHVRSFITNWCSSCMEYPTSYITEFDTEEQLKNLIDKFKPDIILKGNDRTDVKTIVGSDNWPVCILPRIKDKDGNDISTTSLLDFELMLK